MGMNLGIIIIILYSLGNYTVPRTWKLSVVMGGMNIRQSVMMHNMAVGCKLIMNNGCLILSTSLAINCSIMSNSHNNWKYW